MSQLQYYSYDKVGKEMEKMFLYSSAVRIGDRIECSGQGGWDSNELVFSESVSEQTDQAFRNVDLALKTAGGTGWNQVFKIRSYHVALDNNALEAMTRNLAKWMDHKPLWTCIGVACLAQSEMLVEIEVEAYDPK